MVFSSIIFVFLFLALQIGIYYYLDDTKRNKELLIFSLIFYAWGGPVYLLLLTGETAICWFMGLKIAECKKQSADDEKAGRHYLILACASLLGLLCIFKYVTFICKNTNHLFGFPAKIPNIILPIGISFYTFQLLSYVADVYRGDVEAQSHYWKLLLYSSLFHQCIAGPIVRYETISNEIDNRPFNINGLSKGIRRFSIGLAKKAILANTCASMVAVLLPEGVDALASQSTLSLWLGVLCYMFEIYFDFSAYSDMAIGMGQMVGFHYLENFNYPYTATSVQDFWRRWHISLSTFFRDYVYIPLGGNRCSTGKYIRNMCIVWFLTGLWHGASWNYILWGLYYLLFLLLERFVIKGRIPDGLNRVYTLLVIFFGWAIFKFENLVELGVTLKGMFTIHKGNFLGLDAKTQFITHIFFLIFAIIACTPFGKNLHKKMAKEGLHNNNILVAVNIFDAILPALLLLLSLLALVGNSYNPFLYFQF